jgi:hypothetical protein
MEPLDFFPALTQLFDHAIEVSPELTDLVIALREADAKIQVAGAYARNLFLQLHHRTLDKPCQHKN